MATENQNPEIQEEAVEKEAAPKKEKKKRSDKKNEIEALTKELAALKDSHLRTLAEYDNFRKRSQREKEATYADAKANTLKMLLPVLDNFDRAADNKTDDIEVYRKGIEMTLTQLGEILKNLEVEAFGEVGDEFDPNIHNAVFHIDDENYGEGEIVEVFQKGYRKGKHIIRFAMVKTAN